MSDRSDDGQAPSGDAAHPRRAPARRERVDEFDSQQKITDQLSAQRRLRERTAMSRSENPDTLDPREGHRTPFERTEWVWALEHTPDPEERHRLELWRRKDPQAAILWARHGPGNLIENAQLRNSDNPRKKLTDEPPAKDLPKSPNSAFNKSRNMSKVGRLTREAAEFAYPEPDVSDTIADVTARIAEIEERATAHEELGLSSAEVRMAGYDELAQRLHDLAKNIGLHAISAGDITQSKMAKAMGTHQLTITRWVKEARENGRDH